MAAAAEPLHVAMFPFLAYGHIIPFVNLSKQLVEHGVNVTFLTTRANVPRVSDLLSGTPAVHVVAMELPRVDGLPEGVESTAEANFAMAELLKDAIDLLQPQVKSLLDDLRPHVVFHDFCHSWLANTAHPLGIKTVFFSVFSAFASSYLVVPARLEASPDQMRFAPPGFPDLSVTPIQSVPPYQARDLEFIFMRFGGPSLFERVLSANLSCSAIALRTCMEMEGPFVRYLESQYSKPLLLTGPTVPGQPHEGELDERWAEWLDKFPEKSVIFCSFGSENFLRDDAIKELALGLEMTGLPFFLVLNFPKGDHDDHERGEEDQSPMVVLRKKLPDGFEERVRERGLVHSGWVQQRHILWHKSVGCFLGHAGQNSITEGILSGCKLVMLSHKGDQHLLARRFSEELRVGVEVRRDEADGRFERGDVRNAVLKVMKDEETEEMGVMTANLKRWGEFLSDEKIQQGFMREFVQKLHNLVADQ